MKKVVLYSLSTCPWCKRVKRFFEEEGVEFDCVEYDLADEATKERVRSEIKRSGFPLAFPWVRIDGTAVSGFSPARYRELLGLE